MQSGQTPICHYPQGGIAKSAGGRGIFRDSAEEPIRIWVDYMIKSGRSIIQAVRAQDDGIDEIASASHSEPETQLIVLHPSSHHIFDLYCHPDWLTPRSRKKYDQYREQHPDEEEEWTRKVLLKDSWVGRCIEAGRFLGESDGWAGCRVGGPPAGQEVDVQMDVNTITLNNGVKRKLSSADMDEDIDKDMDMELDELDGEEEEEEEEDIKPNPVTELLNTHAPMDIQVEPPTPSQPLDDIRPDTDNISPIEDQDELESLFEEREPTPPPVRRSSRRSRSTTRPSQVKVELESSDEEALATRPRLRLTKRLSARLDKQSTTVSLLGAEDIDISMLDSGPSSQFQSPRPSQTTPVVEGKIFSGLVFWVDLSMKNRGDILKEIKAAGGKIVGDHGDATHVLIYKFAQQAVQWTETIATLAPRGIWFLSPDWAKKSLAAKERVPEIDHCVPGGTLAGDTPANKSAQDTMTSQPQQAAGDNPSMEKLERLFALMKEQGLTPQDIAQKMNTYHGSVTPDKWMSFYQTWEDRTGLFSQHPPLSVAKPSAFAPLQETVLQVKAERPSPGPIKARLSKPEMEAIFANETWRLQKTYSGHVGDFTKFLAGKYKIYTPGSWGNYFSEWYNGRLKWAGTPRKFQGVSLTIGELREGSIANITTPGRDTIELPDDTRNLPLSNMASALHSYYKHSGNNVVINASLGEHMEALYPAYTARAWEKMAREWKEGTKKFADYGSRWDGKPPLDDDVLEDNADEPVILAAGPMPYTEDEELAMGQFVLHQESQGKHVTGGSWAEFAEVYPHRTKGALADRYRVHKARIIELAKRHAASQESQEVIQSDPENFDPTFSERSPSPIASGSQPKPKKQKLAVSKKDYEDLARFIVDNIAEGDVPDSKDFADFAKDHPERSASSWYTIWHRDKYRSTLLPLIDELRRAAAPRSRSSQGRATSKSGSKPHPNAYTDEEEKQMAEFIVRHVPSDRLPKVADWNKFQRNHTKRTAPSWMEHYRVYKPRIDGLVAEIKASNPSIAITARGTAQDAIELGSEEEEEEEVEEIVPIRPPRKGKRSEVIIIED